MTQQPIVVPIALSQTRSAVITLPWFVQRTEYRPKGANYKPLVNGEAAFGALYDAIDNATRTIDYVCWGFQPSMHFRRDGGKSLCIGELLINKAKQGVKVRILCWLDSAWAAQFSEQPMPMYNLYRQLSQNEDRKQRTYDWNWYFRARQPASSAVDPSRLLRAQRIKAGLQQLDEQLRRQGTLPPNSGPSFDATPLRDIGIELVTRDFSAAERDEIEYREKLARQSDAKLTAGQILAYKYEASHHQKMVLIDYEAPEVAVGFVMGHNTLDAYWDDDAHHCVRKAPNRGRNGATPRQDMSAIVAGPILEDLNDNFCRAWERDANEDLRTSRQALKDKLAPRDNVGARVMAQICRTQSQEGVRDIKPLYLQAVSNATKFIYIENQYFRWLELAEKIKSAVQAQIAEGRDPAKPVHLFVVTNASKEGVGVGAGSTYDMVNCLGRADTMPAVARLEQRDSLREQLDAAERSKAVAPTAAQRDAAQQKIDALKRQIEDAENEPVMPAQIPGLNVHICSLIAPDSPPGSTWMPVYVHSKIMIVDDVFLTHGSANINRRSMEVDSELNICHERMDVTQPLRRQLWGIHTNGQGAQDDPQAAGEVWERIIKRNSRKDSGHLPPIASLIGFMWTSGNRLRLD
jgi:phosphatidylserine/phosphatidylglycerophosphate/cardiolipin synthase-like enzyme